MGPDLRRRAVVAVDSSVAVPPSRTSTRWLSNSCRHTPCDGISRHRWWCQTSPRTSRRVLTGGHVGAYSRCVRRTRGSSMLIAASLDRASRHGDVPMLRALRDCTAPPALRRAWLRRPRAAWAELGVLRGEFSAFPLRERGRDGTSSTCGALSTFATQRAGKRTVATRARVAKFGERSLHRKSRQTPPARADGSLDFVMSTLRTRMRARRATCSRGGPKCASVG